MADTGRVAAFLAEARERQRFASDASLGFAQIDGRHQAMIKSCYEDVPRLLAVADEVLRLATEWDKAATETDEMAIRAADRGADWARIEAMTARAQGARDGATALREAISRALLGEEGT